MCALRQFMQVLDARLGAAAARAQQIPSHGDNAAPLRGEEQLDGIRRMACQERASARGRMARSATIGAWRRKSASFGASPWLAGSLSSSAISAARRRRAAGLAASSRLRLECGREFALSDQLFDGRQALVALAVDLAGVLRQPTQHADALDLRGKDIRVPVPSGWSSTTPRSGGSGR